MILIVFFLESHVFNVSFQIIYNIPFQSGDLVFQCAVNKELSLNW